MASNKEHKSNAVSDVEQENLDKEEGFEVSNQGQNLGGGKSDSDAISGTGKHAFGDGGGSFDDEDEFSKTDQSTSQAAPGQTMTYKNQGGS